MQMSDSVADHTADKIYAHMLRCQGVDRFRYWDASRRAALTSRKLQRLRPRCGSMLKGVERGRDRVRAH